MSKWKEFFLDDLAEVLNQKRIPLSSMQRSNRKGIFPYYGASGIIDFIDEYIFSGEHVLISEDGENLKSRQTPIAFLANGNFWVNNHAHIVKGKTLLLNRLIVYYFENLDLNPYLTGAVQPKLNKATLTSIPIYLPESESEQNAIAEVLSSLDDKIDLLHRQNKTLEQLAETLFRQWFVEEAEETITLGDAVKTSSGGTPSRTKMEYYTNGSTSWVKSKELNGGFIFDTEEKITDAALKNSSAKLFPANTILIAMYGATVGEFGILAAPATCNQAVCALLPNENYPYTFLFVFTKLNKENLINMAGGSAQQNISQELIQKLEIPKPSEKIQLFNVEAEPLFQKIKSNTTQIRTLTQLRDVLLPKLMSGEVRVKI